MNLPVAALGIAITVLAAPESTDPGAGRQDRLAGPAGALASGSPRSSWRWSSRAPGAPARSSLWPSSASSPCSPSGGSSTGSREPIVDFELFRNGPYFGASAAAFALVGAYWAVMFFQPQYLQDVRGHSAILSGVMILPITVPMIFISPLLGPPDRPLRRPRPDDRWDGSSAPPACSSSPGSTPPAPTRCCWPATCCSGSPWASSTRRCRPRRWRRCRRRRSGSPPACWRWTGSLAGAVALAATGAVFHALLGDGDSLRRCARRLDLGPGRALRARRRAHLGLRPRRRPPGPDPAVAGDPAPRARSIHWHSPSTSPRADCQPSELTWRPALTKAIPSCPLGISRPHSRALFAILVSDGFSVWG